MQFLHAVNMTVGAVRAPVGETAILLHRPLPSVGVSIAMEMTVSPRRLGASAVYEACGARRGREHQRARPRAARGIDIILGISVR